MTVSELFPVACGLSLLFLFARSGKAMIVEVGHEFLGF
jgi:hypothetical protein